MNAAELTEFAETVVGMANRRATIESTLDLEGVAPSARIVITEPNPITVDLNVVDDGVRASITAPAYSEKTTPPLLIDTPWQLRQIILAYADAS